MPHSLVELRTAQLLPGFCQGHSRDLDETTEDDHAKSNSRPDSSPLHTEKEVPQGLPLLFEAESPLVLNHDDLLEMNIHVDAEFGGITGIVDWAEAKIAPFGTSLWGLETILGVQTSACRHLGVQTSACRPRRADLGVQTSTSRLFHPCHYSLWKEFWDTFYGVMGDLSDCDQRAIEIARILGLFLAYGFDRRLDSGQARVVQEGSPTFICLEAVGFV
ncbi:hypothetical protein QBC33DRAFT_567425 [Phialemonium atrogriseum]|uniref:Aminoglycoside phosphotransferase domain-containing protein n=1 Tax=Phialemonium atrogriseum TaxID=1093897 RepID=A0AAJ0FPA6_9PEZI|nr:uncharacterized protein QBC33DRAFT_567425 [Phialemonium atrogriseum]KAK1770068.1 hypothetical protein QBC33DRAFT_567425 [Phialemonium atrogriseum]